MKIMWLCFSSLIHIRCLYMTILSFARTLRVYCFCNIKTRILHSKSVFWVLFVIFIQSSILDWIKSASWLRFLRFCVPLPIRNRILSWLVKQWAKLKPGFGFSVLFIPEIDPVQVWQSGFIFYKRDALWISEVIHTKYIYKHVKSFCTL